MNNKLHIYPRYCGIKCAALPLIKEDVGMSSNMATVDNVQGVGNAVPPSNLTNNIGSGDNWSGLEKKKKKTKKEKEEKPFKIKTLEEFKNTL